MLKPILKTGEHYGLRTPEAMIEEAVGLAEAIALTVVRAEYFNVNQPVPATLLGSGQVANWGEIVKEEKIQLAIVAPA